MARWQSEPISDEPAPALRSIFEGRDWSQPSSSSVREASQPWREHDGEVLAAPQGRAEEAEPLPENAEQYPLGIARGAGRR